MEPAAKSLTEFALGCMLEPEERAATLSCTDEGHLLVRVAGETMTRTDGLLVCTENLVVRPLARRMQGRVVPEVFARLAALEGDGYLVLAHQGERFHVVDLEGDLCFFVEPYLWAMDAGLLWDVGVVPGTRRDRPIPLVRAAGEGMLAFRVPGRLVAIKVADDRPIRIARDRLVGWVGAVVPRADPEGPFLRCEGEGAVLVWFPRAPADGSSAPS
ncbi:MAG: hypothetical protein D6705_16580 [Deltaproteobacteria bacterium]|nr:MAG: hypothetical protein D6705_16580 [Deltaproteobacteria bacterium]